MSKKILNFLFSPALLIIVFIVGVAVSSLIPSSRIYLLIIVILSVSAIVLVFFKKKFLISCLLIFLMGFLYFWIFSTSLSQITPGCNEVRISSNPQESKGLTTFSVQKSSSQRAFVSLRLSEKLNYSDKINLCFNQENISEVTGNYSLYLKARYKTSEVIKNPEVEKVKEGESPLKFLYLFSAYVSTALSKIFKGDAAVLAKGLILGGTAGFSDSFVDSLRKSGTSHLVAVSGYNVSIITIVLFQMIRQGFSRRSAIITTLIVLAGFCLLTGATASVLRASLMGLFYILAKIIGRKSAVTNGLFVAALIMILLNPYSIFDVGFELSFAATLGLILLEEPLRIIFNRFAKIPEIILTGATATLAAQLFTLPILLFQFNQISLLAPIANILILPFIPLAMLMVLITFIIYQILPIAGIFVGGLTQPILDYVMIVIKFFGGFSFSALTVDASSWIYLILLYAVVIFVTVLIQDKAKRISRNLHHEPI